MTRKLTISIDDAVYDGLIAVVGRGHIGAFLEDLARPFVVPAHLDGAYAEMGADVQRETQASEWTEALLSDQSHAAW